MRREKVELFLFNFSNYLLFIYILFRKNHDKNYLMVLFFFTLDFALGTGNVRKIKIYSSLRISHYLFVYNINTFLELVYNNLILH